MSRVSAVMDVFSTTEQHFENESKDTTEKDSFSEGGDNDESSKAKNLKSNPPLKILFLSSDTGGGHRASAESLAHYFHTLYPNSTHLLLDICSGTGVAPYNKLVQAYQHLSAHPSQWGLVYRISNTKMYADMTNVHLKITTERSVREKIRDYNPDVVISVHPLMTSVPAKACANISRETGRQLPMFTVVTDLGSGHCMWFEHLHIEKVFVGSDAIGKLALSKVPEDKLVRTGLPIRYDFSLQAKQLGEEGRVGTRGRKYQRSIRTKLSIFEDSKVVLVMGGGEGIGPIFSIVLAIFIELTKRKVSGTILVVCGRNAKLKEDLDTQDWNLIARETKKRERRKKRWLRFGKRKDDNGVTDAELETNRQDAGEMIATVAHPGVGNEIPVRENGSMSDISNIKALTDCDAIGNEACDGGNVKVEEKDVNEENEFAANGYSQSSPINPPAQTIVQGLGFVTNIAEYMVAADVLVTKAGPGTIAEAAAVGLPILLTSFLPGQERGNVDFVLKNNFGHYEQNPEKVAFHVANWLQDSETLDTMSQKAMEAGEPDAAENIAKIIGKSVVRWKDLNEEQT